MEIFNPQGTSIYLCTTPTRSSKINPTFLGIKYAVNNMVDIINYYKQKVNSIKHPPPNTFLSIVKATLIKFPT